MATGKEVLEMLIPTGGWAISGNDFEGVQFLECNPITKKEFDDGFTKYDSWKAAKEAAKEAAKVSALAKLAALGLTPEEISAIS